LLCTILRCSAPPRPTPTEQVRHDSPYGTASLKCVRLRLHVGMDMDADADADGTIHKVNLLNSLTAQENSAVQSSPLQ
jgi:hypothetical protein